MHNSFSKIQPDQLYPLSDVRDLLPTRPDKATIWRWCSLGIKLGDGRIKLAHVRIGGRLFVGGQALLDFLQAEPTKSPPAFRSPAQRERESRASGRRLANRRA